MDRDEDVKKLLNGGTVLKENRKPCKNDVLECNAAKLTFYSFLLPLAYFDSFKHFSKDS